MGDGGRSQPHTHLHRIPFHTSITKEKKKGACMCVHMRTEMKKKHLVGFFHIMKKLERKWILALQEGVPKQGSNVRDVSTE